jgi:cytochrome b561
MEILFAATSRAAVYSERIAIILGITTVVLALAAFLSCRAFVSLLTKLGVKHPTRNRIFRSFYGYHLYYWWGFGVAVLSHVIMAISHTGLPQAGPPDAGVHWAILSIGFPSALSGVALFSSCRVSPRLLAPAIKNLTSQGNKYRSFFSYHSYFWWIFTALVASHFTAGYLHAGVWPGVI